MKKTLITLAAMAVASVAMATTPDDGNPWNDVAYNEAFPTGWTSTNENDINFSNTSGEYTMILVLNQDVAYDAESGLKTYNDGEANWSEIKIGAAGSGMWNNHAIRFFKASDNSSIDATLYVNGERKYTPDNPEDGSLGKDIYNTSAYLTDDNLVKGKLAIYIKVTDGTVVVEENGQNVTKNALTFTLGVLEGDETISYGSYTQVEWEPSMQFDSVQFSGVPEGFVEHMMIFNEALSEDEIKRVMLAIVPEPTTATLSLLALAGLAARRRRK